VLHSDQADYARRAAARGSGAAEACAAFALAQRLRRSHLGIGTIFIQIRPSTNRKSEMRLIALSMRFLANS
jgi:hypothetical protein